MPGGKVKNIRKGFEAACCRARLVNVTLHTIRHSSAVAMVSNGVPLAKVAQYLGHSNFAITYQTYARFAPDHLKDAAEILDFVQILEARRSGPQVQRTDGRFVKPR